LVQKRWDERDSGGTVVVEKKGEKQPSKTFEPPVPKTLNI